MEPGAHLLPSLCIFSCLLAPGGLGAEGRVARRLLRDLFANYSSALLPGEGTGRALNVSLHLSLSQVIDVDERKQVLTTYLWVRQAWQDAHLSWDKEAYGGIASLRVPSSYVWRPDISLYNNAAERPGGSPQTNVVLSSDGLILWDSPAIAKSSCKVDVSYFPFDGQSCPLTFGSWTYSGRQLDLRQRRAAGDLGDLVENGEWEVLGMAASRHLVSYGCCSEPYPDVTYTLVLRRRAASYVCNLLLPCLMVSILAPLGFSLPAACGEKVALGVAVLLALTFFQLLLAESMPPAQSLPLIGKYYLATMTMVTVSTALTIFILSLHHCGPGARPVPPWAKRFFLQHLARLCCSSVPGGSRGSPRRAPAGRAGRGQPGSPGGKPEVGQEGGEAGRCPRGRCLCHQRVLLRNVRDISDCLRRHRAAQRRAGDWQEVAKVLDRCFMWLFLAMVLLSSLLVLARAAWR